MPEDGAALSDHYNVAIPKTPLNESEVQKNKKDAEEGANSYGYTSPSQNE